MKRTSLAITILLFLAGACTPPPSRPPVRPLPGQTVPPPTASASAEVAPPPDPAIVSVTAVRPPTTLAIDGDVREWGSLLPPLESELEPPPVATKEKPKAPPPAPSAEEKEDSKEPPPSGPNPREAASHLAFALTNDALLIAAELGEPARDGIWLGVGSTAPPVPSIGGYYGRGGDVGELDCKFKQIFGIEGAVDRGDPNPPEVVAACEALIVRHAEFVARHARRFARRFKIDREGVRGVAADGTLYAFEDAKAVWKPGAKGATVEITLPLKAMPRVNEAPLTTLRLVARAATSPKPPDFAPDSWVWVPLPDAVSFEPNGEVRAHAFEALVGVTGSFVPVLSYQPGDALHVETMHYPGGPPTSVIANEETLYTKQASFGDVEIGYASAYGQSLAIFKKGKLADVVYMGGEPRGIIPRDGELHVIMFAEGYFSPYAGEQPPTWSVIAVARDGSHREEVVDRTADVPRWEDASEFANTALDTFGVRGSTHYPVDYYDHVEKALGLEVTYRWDERSKTYVAKRRRIPVPRQAKKK